MKTAVKLHYYTYPRKNDHELFTHLAFVYLLFFQEGKCYWFFSTASWFSYGRFSVGEGVLEEENHTQIKIKYPPRILQLCGQVCLIKNTCILYLIVFNCI